MGPQQIGFAGQSRSQRQILSLWQLAKSRDGHQVLKCTVWPIPSWHHFYLLVTGITTFFFLGHFSGPVARQAYSCHLTVISITGAYNGGPCWEAVLIAMIAFAYAEIVFVLSHGCGNLRSRTSTGLFVPAHEPLFLIIFVGGRTRRCGWFKQKITQPLSIRHAHLPYSYYFSHYQKKLRFRMASSLGDKMSGVKDVGIGINIQIHRGGEFLLVWRLSLAECCASCCHY